MAFVENKKIGVLFTGGKDSCYAMFLAKKQGFEIACLISIESENLDSYMFHTPSISQVRKQAEVLELPLIIQKTKGEKEEELKDLDEAIKKAKEKFDISGIVTGAIESVYQSSRIKKICDKYKLECINPLWHKDSWEYWNELLKNNFKIIITSVSAEGLGKEWLGKEIDGSTLNKLRILSSKYKFNLAFEGGEAETMVLDCPLFKKRIKIRDYDIEWVGNAGVYIIKKINLIDK